MQDKVVQRFYREGLRLAIDGADPEAMANILNVASDALAAERLGWPIPMEDQDSLHTAATRGATERHFPRAVPPPYRSLDEFLLPELVNARESGGNVVAKLRELDVPLIRQPLKPAEERRILKAMKEYLNGDGNSRGVRLWMYDLDPTDMATLILESKVPPSVREVLAEHPSPEIKAALDRINTSGN